MQTTELKVDGMTCGSCVASVTKALKRVPGVQDVEVDLGSGIARVHGEHAAHQVPEVVAALAAAAAEGDRSENAEYTYRKRQLGEIDRRVRYLTRRLEHIKVVDTLPSDRSAVYFGAWVHLESIDDDRELRVRIVGPDETDAALGWISIDSPIARAALKRRVDDEFEAELPGGRARFVIVAVRYEA